MALNFIEKWIEFEDPLGQGNPKNPRADDVWCGRTSGSMLYNYYHRAEGIGGPKGLILNNQDKAKGPYDIIFSGTRKFANKVRKGKYKGQASVSQALIDEKAALGEVRSGPLFPKAGRYEPDDAQILDVLAPITTAIEHNNPVVIYTGISRSTTKPRHIIVVSGYRLDDQGLLWLHIYDPSNLNDRRRKVFGDNIVEKAAGAWNKGQASNYWLKARYLFRENSKSKIRDDWILDHCDRPGLYHITLGDRETPHSKYVHETPAVMLLPFAKYFDTEDDKHTLTRDHLDEAYKHTEQDSEGGYFPLGKNTVWHGGLHFFEGPGEPIVACARGEVVAARLPKEDPKDVYYGSRSFVLMRHEFTAHHVRQLHHLYVPKHYTVTQDDAPSPWTGTDGFRLLKGDRLRRVDPEDERERESVEGTGYQAQIASLTPRVEKITHFDVTEADEDAEPVVLKTKELAKEGSDEPGDFPLEAGDRLELLEPIRHDDFDGNGTKCEVKIASLAKTLVKIKTYRVGRNKTSHDFRKTEDGDAPTTTDVSKDEDRIADLIDGDVLELLTEDKAGSEDDEGDKKVKVHSLATKKDGSAKRAVSGYAMKAWAWSFRGAATQKKADRICYLRKKDELELVQAHARVIEGKAYDLVKLKALVNKTQEPSHYHVYKSNLQLYAAATGDDATELTQGLDLHLTWTAKQNGRVEVETADGKTKGWIKPWKVRNAARPEIKRYKDLVGEEAYIDPPQSKDAKRLYAARTLKVGTEGYVTIDPDSGTFVADGDRRHEIHAKKIGWEGTIEFQDERFAPDGVERNDYFEALFDEAKSLNYAAAAFAEFCDIRGDVAAYYDGLSDDAKCFYSLAMHLDNGIDLTKDNGDLQDFSWIPRNLLYGFTLTRAHLLVDTPDGSPELQLIPDDKLRVVWDEHTAHPHYHVAIEELAEGSKVVGLTVKSGNHVAMFSDDDGTELLVGLQKGDHLLPGEDGLEPGEFCEVTLDTIDATGDVPGYAVQKRKKKRKVRLRTEDGMKSSKAEDPTVAELLEGDTLSVIAQLGKVRGYTWDLVRVESVADGDDDRSELVGKLGYIATDKKLGQVKADDSVTRDTAILERFSSSPMKGWVKYEPGAYELEEEAVDRAALFAEEAKSGRWIFHHDIASDSVTDDLMPDERALEELAKGEVVTFPLAVEGDDADSDSSSDTDECVVELLASNPVEAGAPLWKSGVYGPPKDDLRKPMLHWEVFSSENLIPEKFLPGWTDAVDTGADWNMDSEKILEIIEEALGKIDPDYTEAKQEAVKGQILSAEETKAIYGDADTALALRHVAAKFTNEWALDLSKALHNLRLLETGVTANAKYVLGTTTRENYAGNSPKWVRQQKNRIAPLQWWHEAIERSDASGGKPIGLPSDGLVWHYNPITFVATFSERLLDRQEGSGG